jgi:uroporphyrinogen-III decarboxylase
MEKQWEQLTIIEKREARFAHLASPKLPDGTDILFQNVEAEKAYKASVKRLKDIIELKKPDRVPIMLMCTFLPANLGGASAYEAMYNTERLESAFIRFMTEYKPDFFITPGFMGNGKIFDILGYKLLNWPGHGLLKSATGFQYSEGEYMLAEDYPAFIDDPTDFYLRTYMPRVFGALDGLKMISPFTELWEPANVGFGLVNLGMPAVQDALKKLMEAGSEAMQWMQTVGRIEARAKSMGYVSGSGGAAKAPFDYLADTLRGSKGIMLDMYKRPDMLIKAMERLVPIAVKSGVNASATSGHPMIFMPLHRGGDEFMSDEQYKKFYWPTFKEVLLGLMEEGCVPALFCEGSYNSRLGYLEELPPGTLWLFDRTDMTRVKERVGKNIAIAGNVPASLLFMGSTDEIKAYCKDLIDIVGQDGGYMMSNGTSMDEANAGAVHAMIDFTKEYGVYD